MSKIKFPCPHCGRMIHVEPHAQPKSIEYRTLSEGYVVGQIVLHNGQRHKILEVITGKCGWSMADEYLHRPKYRVVRLDRNDEPKGHIFEVYGYNIARI